MMKKRFMNITAPRLLLSLIAAMSLLACSSRGPDKTAIGTTIGAGIGAGAGAIIGNQVGRGGEGAAIGAGIGGLDGGLTGASIDAVERELHRSADHLAQLKRQNDSNRAQLIALNHRLDRSLLTEASGGMYQVFFDAEATSLRAGSIANLESMADALLRSPSSFRIKVSGHADDSGEPQQNKTIAEARARSVVSYLAGRGISMQQIDVESHGAKRPIASNSTPMGRQLNRRVDIFVSR